MGGIQPGDTVVGFGAGPVGIMAARCAWLFGAARVIVIDREEYRLALASQYAPAETYNFEALKDPVVFLKHTTGIGADVCIDAVGADAAGSRMQTIMGRKLLLEGGATFVKVTHSNYDTHHENFDFHIEQLGEFDRPFATLLEDLEVRGLLDSTLVLALGEEGRAEFGATDALAQRLLGLSDLSREFHFHRGVRLGLHELQHGAKIFYPSVHFAPGLQLPLHIVLLFDRVLSCASVRPEVGSTHTLLKGLDLSLQRGEVKDASENRRIANERRSVGSLRHRAWSLPNV